MAATAAKWAFALGAGAFGGLVGVGYTNPSWTKRRFDPSRCPEFKYSCPPNRDACVQKLSTHNTPDKPLDVLVIGGGCVGTGIALDAATRGLEVGLVEMSDYASQTSSRSTKLIHGGIRYLQKAVFQLSLDQLKLVAEALRERTVMVHQCPHLCMELPTIIPCYRYYEIPMYWAGTKMYDLVASIYGGTLGFSSFLSPADVRRRFPALRDTNDQKKRLLGAVRYYDGQMNDARLCYSVAMTSACYGAATVNYAKATGMEVVRDRANQEVVQVKVTDMINNKEMVVYAKSIVNAGGPFTSMIEDIASHPQRKVDILPALGTHIIVDRRYAPKPHEAMVVPSSDDRVVFSIPWLGGTLIGTTDHPCPVTENPRPPREDVEFLLRNVEPYLGVIPPEHVRSCWAGIRPLAKHSELTGTQGGTQNVVRDHIITVDEQNRIVDIAGGKWTTYRRMAEEATDKLLQTLLKDRVRAGPCVTEDVVMLGSKALQRVPMTARAAGDDIPEDVHKHWRYTYGDCYPELATIAREKQGALMKRLVADCPVTEAEVWWAAHNEHCENIMDFVARRTRMAFIDVAKAEQAVPRVAELMGQAKNWSASRRTEEMKRAYEYLNMFKPE